MTATSDLECYALDRKTFDSLLGPVEDLWRFEALRKVPLRTLCTHGVVLKRSDDADPVMVHMAVGTAGQLVLMCLCDTGADPVCTQRSTAV